MFWHYTRATWIVLGLMFQLLLGGRKAFCIHPKASHESHLPGSRLRVLIPRLIWTPHGWLPFLVLFHRYFDHVFKLLIATNGESTFGMLVRVSEWRQDLTQRNRRLASIVDAMPTVLCDWLPALPFHCLFPILQIKNISDKTSDNGGLIENNGNIWSRSRMGFSYGNVFSASKLIGYYYRPRMWY